MRKLSEIGHRTVMPKSPGYDSFSQPYIDRFEVPPHEQKKSERMRSLLGDRKFKRALDIGCGIGLMTRFFVNCCDQIYGVDLDPGKINYIRHVVPCGNHFLFEVADLEKVDFCPEYVKDLFGENQFDLIIYTDVAYYLSESARKNVAKAIVEMLDPEGLLIVSQHAAKIPERIEQRMTLEEENLWLLHEEVFTSRTYWVFQIYCRWPPLTTLADRSRASLQTVRELVSKNIEWAKTHEGYGEACIRELQRALGWIDRELEP